jgi:SAM-dependent methyltransferase
MPKAHTYHQVHLTHDPVRSLVWQVVADHLSEWVPPQAHVLEIGAGYCAWINAVKSARRVAVDIWPDIVQYAAAGVEPVVLDLRTGLRALGESSFDVVLASNVLEHFEPDAAADIVANVAGLLRPNGRFIVIQPNFRYAWKQYFDDYTHRSIFTHVSLTALLRARGFAIDRVQPRFLPYSMRDSRLPIRPWLVRAYLSSPVKPRAGQMLVVARRG